MDISKMVALTLAGFGCLAMLFSWICLRKYWIFEERGIRTQAQIVRIERARSRYESGLLVCFYLKNGEEKTTFAQRLNRKQEKTMHPGDVVDIVYTERKFFKTIAVNVFVLTNTIGKPYKIYRYFGVGLCSIGLIVFGAFVIQIL